MKLFNVTSSYTWQIVAIQPEAISAAQNAQKAFGDPGSAWARGGAYSALLDPLAGFKRTALRHEREGREGTTGGGKERVLRIITRISPVRGSATEIQGGNYQI